jgi:hypothetical protein
MSDLSLLSDMLMMYPEITFAPLVKFWLYSNVPDRNGSLEWRWKWMDLLPEDLFEDIL